MKLSQLLFSEVHAQQIQPIDPIPPKPVTTTPTPVTIQSKGDSSQTCDDKYGSLHIKNGPNGCICKDIDGKEKSCSVISQSSLNQACTSPKYSEWVVKDGKGTCSCVNGQAKNGDGSLKNECIVNKAGSVGIKCTAQDLINNTCSRNINKTLGIRGSDTTPNPTLLLQDVTLAATSFVGTIIMIALVYLGITAVLKGTDDADALGDIKTKARNLIIGLLLVIGSYTIIRLVQYIAKGI